MQCRCPCHTDPDMKHVIPCCGRALRISENALRGIVEASVSDAFAVKRMEDEAQRQEKIQQDLQAQLAATTASGNDSDKGLGEEAPPDPMSGAPKSGVPPDPQAQQAQQVRKELPLDADAIIDKFNIIRSGRSMNDRDIKDLMKKMLGTLTPPQMQAFFGVLQRIGQIVAPAVDSQRVHAPAEEPSAVKDARLQMLQKRKDAEDQAIAQRPAPEQSASPPPKPTPEDEEDTSPPIRVGARVPESVHRKMKLLIEE